MKSSDVVAMYSGSTSIDQLESSKSHENTFQERILSDPCYVTADWGGLPVSICQQIIGQDKLTFGKGAQVCKAWYHASKSEGAGPRILDLRGKACFGWAACKYLEHAPPDLTALKLDLWWNFHPEDVLMSFCSLLTPFSMLTTLVLEYTGIVDCSKFSSLPQSLVKLQIGLLPCFQAEPQSIDCFNRFCALEELILKFMQYDHTGIPFNVTGNLSLPKLQWLTFEAELESSQSGPVVLTELNCDEIATLVFLQDDTLQAPLMQCWTIVDRFHGLTD